MESLANNQLGGLGQRLDGLVLAQVLSLAVDSGVVGRNDVLELRYRVSMRYADNWVCLRAGWSLTSAEVLFVPSSRWFRSR